MSWMCAPDHHPLKPSRWNRLPRWDGREPVVRVFQLPPPAIQFLAAHSEASEGIGLVRTLDEQRGLIECWIMPEFEPAFDNLLRGAAAQWPVQEIGTDFE